MDSIPSDSARPPTPSVVIQPGAVLRGAVDLTGRPLPNYYFEHLMNVMRLCKITYREPHSFFKNGNDIFELKGYMAHGHASECGTSVMLYLRPDLVDMSKARKVEPSTDVYQVYTDVIRYIPFSRRTPNGTIGDATIGTAEKGRALLEKSVGRIADYMVHEFGIELKP